MPHTAELAAPSVAGRVVVIDHYDSYTYNLVDLIARVSGSLPIVVQHDQVSLGSLSAAERLVLSPGPGRPDNAADFALGPGVFFLRVPVLGVCLGLQALVTSFGGDVEPSEPAHGHVSHLEHSGEGLFAGVSQGIAVVRYHSLAASRVPATLEVTAHSEDGVVMAVQHRALPLMGVQFHPESVLSEGGEQLIANFLAVGPG